MTAGEETYVDYTRARKGARVDGGHKVVVCPVCGRKGALEPSERFATVVHERRYTDEALYRAIREQVSCRLNVEASVALMDDAAVKAMAVRAARDAMGSNPDHEKLASRLIAAATELIGRGWDRELLVTELNQKRLVSNCCKNNQFNLLTGARQVLLSLSSTRETR